MNNAAQLTAVSTNWQRLRFNRTCYHGVDAYEQNTDFSDREGNRALLSLYHFRYNCVVFSFNILTKAQSCIQNIWPGYIGYFRLLFLVWINAFVPQKMMIYTLHWINLMNSIKGIEEVGKFEIKPRKLRFKLVHKLFWATF